MKVSFRPFIFHRRAKCDSPELNVLAALVVKPYNSEVERLVKSLTLTLTDYLALILGVYHLDEYFVGKLILIGHDLQYKNTLLVHIAIADSIFLTNQRPTAVLEILSAY